MSHHLPAVSWQDARAAVHGAASAHLAAQNHELPLTQAIGSTLARDVVTELAVPHYDSSAMDGYAVAGPPPWRLIYPDYPEDPTENLHRLTVELAPGSATPIFTGGLLPAGAESIVRAEHARTYGTSAGEYVEPLSAPPAAGADMRRTGEERAAGATLAYAGQMVSARLAASLAMGGTDKVTVYEPVTVAVAFSGNEVISHGIPGPGQVRDAFSGFAEHLIEAYGARLVSSARLPDTPQAFESWMRDTNAQVLIVTGGSSTSGVDMVRSTVQHLDAAYLFESVTVRPGHPALAAVLPGRRVLLGLPGNPYAAYTALCSYLPALLDGAYQRELAECKKAPLGRNVAVRGTGTTIVPAHWQEGTLMPLPRAQSHMLGGFAVAEVLAVVSASENQAGGLVPYLPLP